MHYVHKRTQKDKEKAYVSFMTLALTYLHYFSHNKIHVTGPWLGHAANEVYCQVGLYIQGIRLGVIGA